MCFQAQYIFSKMVTSKGCDRDIFCTNGIVSPSLNNDFSFFKMFEAVIFSYIIALKCSIPVVSANDLDGRQEITMQRRSKFRVVTQKLHLHPIHFPMMAVLWNSL